MGDHVYIGNRDKFVYCLNKKSGELVWKYNTGEQGGCLTGGGGKQVADCQHEGGSVPAGQRNRESRNGPMNWEPPSMPTRRW